jgi:hypothetical protein
MALDGGVEDGVHASKLANKETMLGLLSSLPTTDE